MMGSIVIASLLVGVFGPTPQEIIRQELREVPPGERPEMASEPGWEWLARPRKFQIGRTWGVSKDDGVFVSGYSVVDAENGVLRIHYVHTGPGGFDVEVPQSRVVLFDADGKRYLLDRDDTGGFTNKASHLQYAVFSLDQVTLKRVRFAYLGVEQLKSVQPKGEKAE